MLPFFFVMFGLFNGVVQSYSMLPVFWSSWMYWVNPATYWIGGMLAATMDGVPIQCDPSETAQFDVPPNQTCQSYAGEFAQAAGGYLLNPDATSGCQYCQYSVANQYLATLNIEASEKWRGTLLSRPSSFLPVGTCVLTRVTTRPWHFRGLLHL